MRASYPAKLRKLSARDVPALAGGATILIRFLNIATRSEEHTSELQSPCNLVCRLLLESHPSPRALHSFPTRRSSDLRQQGTGNGEPNFGRQGEPLIGAPVSKHARFLSSKIAQAFSTRRASACRWRHDSYSIFKYRY